MNNIFTDHKFDCDNVEYYSGEYKCEAEGTMAGVTTTAKSEGVTIDTICTLWITFWNIHLLLNDYLIKKHKKLTKGHLLRIKFLLSFFIDPAFWAGKDKLTSALKDDEQKQIVCNVCAEPPVDSLHLAVQQTST